MIQNPNEDNQRAIPVRDEKRSTDGSRTWGSDYSATLLVEALQIDEFVIWADLDGVWTADP
jgi:hypothetical protein